MVIKNYLNNIVVLTEVKLKTFAGEPELLNKTFSEKILVSCYLLMTLHLILCMRKNYISLVTKFVKGGK